jgi:2-oxoglutarate dehydrogenase E1 component
VDPARVKRVVLTSGKLYYDLVRGRDEQKADHVALVRLEQLYPFPGAEIGRTLARYSAGAEVVWAQEEPRNMGAWRFVREAFADGLVAGAQGRSVRYLGRAASAAPAPGSHKAVGFRNSDLNAKFRAPAHGRAPTDRLVPVGTVRSANYSSTFH